MDKLNLVLDSQVEASLVRKKFADDTGKDGGYMIIETQQVSNGAYVNRS